jgi:hypothetical protein
MPTPTKTPNTMGSGKTTAYHAVTARIAKHPDTHSRPGKGASGTRQAQTPNPGRAITAQRLQTSKEWGVLTKIVE